MKKITLLLLMLISGTVFGQTATAPVSAEIVQPITVSSSGTLNFGAFTAPTSGAGFVTVTAAGVRTFSLASEMEIPKIADADVTVPTFTVSRDTKYTYKTTLEVTKQPKETGGATMTLSDLTSSESLTSSSASTFTVGGKLSVPTGQTVGVYTGEVKVTVAYE